MKRMLSFLLVLGMLLSMIPAVMAEEAPQSVDQCCHTLRPGARASLNRPQFAGNLIEISRQRVDDTFRYLDEMYVQQYPEAALTVNDMDEEDREVLRKLSGIITEGCETDREKADAISAWVGRNILYDVNASAYPNDTFYNRIGNCLSYAMLMQTLMRFAGVPAVWGDGWRGDMKEVTVDLFNNEGHAWCFAYVDEQWLLYDPLWLSEPTTDREYMAEWIWMDTVECVTPAYDSENLPPEAWNKPKTYYTDSVFCVFDDTHPEGYGNFTSFVNNRAFNFTPRQDEPDGSSDGWTYVDSTKDETGIRKGEVYRDGWIAYGDYHSQQDLSLTYAHFNGMQIDGSVMEFEGVDRMIQANQSFKILVDPDVYSICYGAFTMQKGYTGPFLAAPWGDAYRTDEYVATWESDTPEVAVVDNEGNITCLSEGFAQIKLMLTDEDMGESGYYSITYMNIYVADEERVPDYTDHLPEHPEPPTQEGVIPSDPTEPEDTQPTEPQQPELSDFTDVVPGAFYVEPVAWAVETGVTNGTSSTTFSPGDPCKRSQVVTFLWRAEGEPDFASAQSAFSDVQPGKFYTDSVAWAVENGITNGMGDGTFGVNKVCSRAQVVTFLWRTAGKPEPETDQCPFTDVQPGSYYYDAVLWAVENGITNGMGGDIFGVNGDCTRGQIVTFLWRYVHN